MLGSTSNVRAGSVRFVLAVGLAATLAATQLSASERQDPLVGTWAVEVTLQDCDSGAPLGAPINSVVTFHEGGTLSESPGATAFASGQRSDALGTWTRRGRHYVQRMLAIIRFTTEPNLPGMPTFDPTKPITPGFFAGWQTITQKVQLTSANRLVSSGGNEFFKASGELYRTGCSSAVGERFR